MSRHDNFLPESQVPDSETTRLHPRLFYTTLALSFTIPVHSPSSFLTHLQYVFQISPQKRFLDLNLTASYFRVLAMSLKVPIDVEDADPCEQPLESTVESSAFSDSNSDDDQEIEEKRKQAFP